MKGPILFLTLCALVCNSGDAVAGKSAFNFADAQKALTYLLAVSEEPIPTGSSCSGSFGQAGKATVKDLVAMELASLRGGKNSVIADCKGSNKDSCSVTISHSEGEAVSSAKISFNVSEGKVNLGSLSCVITP